MMIKFKQLKNQFLILFLVFSFWDANAQNIDFKCNSLIKQNSIKAEFDFFSSDWFEGREAGEKGNDLAADYLASIFKQIGLLPFNLSKNPKIDKRYYYSQSGDYFQNIPFYRYTVSEKELLTIITNSNETQKQNSFKFSDDFWFVHSIAAENIEINAPVVFVGYGISDLNNGYDDYKDIDVKGKIVVFLIGYPGYKDTTSIAYKKLNYTGNTWAIEGKKFKTAKQKGAIAALRFNTTEEWLIPKNIYRYNYKDYEGDVPPAERSYYNIAYDSISKSIPIVAISSRIANELTNKTDVNILQFENNASQNFKTASKLLNSKIVHFKISTNSEMIKSQNIIAYIQGEISNEFIIVGAHYDHLGKQNGFIYNGADDNASGTIAVVSIARAFREMKIKPKRSIIFALWTAEEKGLLGSEYFVKNWDNDKINSYFNFDMISRYNQNDSANILEINYTKNFKNINEVITNYNNNDLFKLKIRFKPQDLPDGDTDFYSFGIKGIPICGFFTGLHSDYHRFSDHSDKANIEDLTKIINLGFLTVWGIANNK